MIPYMREINSIAAAWKSGLSSANDALERILEVIHRGEKTLWSEIVQAMRQELPVEYRGVTYDKITACLVGGGRGRRSGVYREKLCVELLDKNAHSVTLAPADKIIIIKHQINEVLFK